MYSNQRGVKAQKPKASQICLSPRNISIHGRNPKLLDQSHLVHVQVDAADS